MAHNINDFFSYIFLKFFVFIKILFILFGGLNKNPWKKSTKKKSNGNLLKTYKNLKDRGGSIRLFLVYIFDLIFVVVF